MHKHFMLEYEVMLECLCMLEYEICACWSYMKAPMTSAPKKPSRFSTSFRADWSHDEPSPLPAVLAKPSEPTIASYGETAPLSEISCCPTPMLHMEDPQLPAWEPEEDNEPWDGKHVWLKPGCLQAVFWSQPNVVAAAWGSELPGTGFQDLDSKPVPKPMPRTHPGPGAGLGMAQAAPRRRLSDLGSCLDLDIWAPPAPDPPSPAPALDPQPPPPAYLYHGGAPDLSSSASHPPAPACPDPLGLNWRGSPSLWLELQEQQQMWCGPADAAGTTHPPPPKSHEVQGCGPRNEVNACEDGSGPLVSSQLALALDQLLEACRSSGGRLRGTGLARAQPLV
ncbi:hypothetical protein QJQ45_015798 [Haematococcus lacustris]|nr:hypothetical protein QJQ45_015798 [Haematococcus lacustris]